MNNAYLSRISTEELYNQSNIRAKKYRPYLAELNAKKLIIPKQHSILKDIPKKIPKDLLPFKM
jgi:hypothetical protein